MYIIVQTIKILLTVKTIFMRKILLITTMLAGLLICNFYQSNANPTDQERPDQFEQINLDLDDENLNWEGTYTLDGKVTLTISQPDLLGEMKFRLLQTLQDCIGDIEGTALLVSENKAEFYPEDDYVCSVKLEFLDENTIRVIEKDCGNFIGIYCDDFSGIYKAE